MTPWVAILLIVLITGLLIWGLVLAVRLARDPWDAWDQTDNDTDPTQKDDQ